MDMKTNELQISQRLSAQIQTLAERWGISAQAALVAAVEEMLQQSNRNPDAYPECLLATDRGPAAEGISTVYSQVPGFSETVRKHRRIDKI